MVKQLYDYWFVQFDFPDENGNPYKSSGGKMVWNEKLKREIPAGWTNIALRDYAEIYNGATPSTEISANYGGDIIWITPKDLSDQQSKFTYYGHRNITSVGYNSCSTRLLPAKTILLSSRAPIGLISIAMVELCTNQGFKSLVCSDLQQYAYLYYYVKHHIKQIEQLGTGTTFKEVSRDDLCSFPILKVQSVELMHKWFEQTEPILMRQYELTKEINFLSKQRDELLTLLMTGQASVAQLNNDLASHILLPYMFFTHKRLYLYGLNITHMKEPGYVYILTNPSFKEDWVKIGKSSRPVNVRSKELDNTAVPLPFEIFATIRTVKYNEVEKLIHKTIDRLTDLRIRQNREFFNIQPQIALDILRDISTTIDDAFIELYHNNQPIKEVAEVSTDEPHKRRAPFKFSMVNIPIGETIIFSPLNIKVKVASDNQIEYEGRIYKLSPFTAAFLPDDMRNTSDQYQGPKYFTYQGKALDELRKELEDCE